MKNKYDYLGQRIKKEREKRFWSQEYLGNKIRILRPNVARIEQGKHRTSILTLIRIAEAFKISVDDLTSKVEDNRITVSPTVSVTILTV